MELLHSPAVHTNETLCFKNTLSKEYTVDWPSNIGEGASGRIRKCVSVTTGKGYALKILPDNEESRQELQCWKACMPHPNVVALVDLFKEDLSLSNDGVRRPWIIAIMDLMEGGDLYYEVVRRRRLAEADAQFVTEQLMQVVGHMHMRGFCHRDLKLENILLESNKSFKIRICDFGFATGRTAVACKHSPLYAPPEVLRSGQYLHLTQHGVAYSYLCDEWSVGVCVYIMLCGYPPFPSSIGHRMTPELQARILRGDFSFPFREWQAVSSDAKELICGLLRVDASRRTTAAAALRHGWLASQTARYACSMREPADGAEHKRVSTGGKSRACATPLAMETNDLFRRRMGKKACSSASSPASSPCSPASPAAASHSPAVVSEASTSPPSSPPVSAMSRPGMACSPPVFSASPLFHTPSESLDAVVRGRSLPPPSTSLGPDTVQTPAPSTSLTQIVLQLQLTTIETSSSS